MHYSYRAVATIVLLEEIREAGAIELAYVRAPRSNAGTRTYVRCLLSLLIELIEWFMTEPV